MEILTCSKCGSSDFFESDGFRVCSFCHAKYELERTKPESLIALDDDIKRLLEKCETDPLNARRYASLVLDLDPLNQVARTYL